MSKSRSRSFAFRQARLALLIACSLGVIFSMVQVYVDFEHQRQELTVDVLHHTESVSPSAANALWELNEDLANAIVNGLFGYHAIVGVSLKTTSDFVLATGTKDVKPHGLRVLVDYLFGTPMDKVVSLSYNDGGHLIPVGSLTVICDPLTTATAFFNRSLVIIITGFVQSLLLGAALLAAFYLTQTRPLTALANQLNRFDPRDQHAPEIKMPTDHASDELGQIADATNRHIRVIREHLRNLNEAHHALRNTNAILEQKVAARTEGLTHEIGIRRQAETRLREALAEAEKSAKVRTLFLANMSHELRTPLNAILGYSDYARLFLDKLDQDKIQEYLNHIHSSGTHLLALVNSILDLSRMDAGQMPVHLDTFDIGKTSRDVTEELRAVIGRNGNTVEFKLSDEPIEIVSDPLRARQVLYNLIGNAAKFTKEGTITITTENHGDYATIKIADTGIGIDKSAIEAIFENFYQADSGMTRRYEGSGLGLAIVRNLCKLLDWKVRVESTVGEGSTFILDIPFRHSLSEDA